MWARNVRSFWALLLDAADVVTPAVDVVVTDTVLAEPPQPTRLTPSTLPHAAIHRLLRMRTAILDQRTWLCKLVIVLAVQKLLGDGQGQ
jgi:hypothetical protein